MNLDLAVNGKGAGDFVWSSSPGSLKESGERVRNLLRGREVLAGCRGAAMTKPF